VLFDDQLVSLQEIIDTINTLGYQAGEKKEKIKNDKH
jgi:hypothetical protein